MTGTAACGKALPKEGKGEITNGVNGGGDRPKALQRYESNKNYCYEILHPLVKIFRRLVRSMCSDHGAEPAVGLRDTDEDGVMTFRADGLLLKLTLLGEDEIKVSQYGQWILIDGIRRGVARAGYKLDSYIQMTKHD